MEKKTRLIVMITTILILLSASAVFAFQFGGKEMVKNGEGDRTIFPFGAVYHVTLWVPVELHGKSGKDIIEANQSMSIVIHLQSNMITKERFVKSISSGFDRVAAFGYTCKSRQAIIDLFNPVTFSKGDTLTINYTPMMLSAIFKSASTGKAETLGAINDPDLKKALFAMWLGPNMPQESLKRALLAGK